MNSTGAVEAARKILGQLCLHCSTHGGKGNPFESMRWDWFIDLAAPKLAELMAESTHEYSVSSELDADEWDAEIRAEK